MNGHYTTDGIRQRRDTPEPNDSDTSAPGLLFLLNDADHTRKTVSRDLHRTAISATALNATSHIHPNDVAAISCLVSHPHLLFKLLARSMSTAHLLSISRTNHPRLRTSISFPSHTRDFDVRGGVVAPPIYNKQLFNDAAFRQSVWPLDAHLLSVSFSHTHCLRTVRVLNAPN